MLSLHPTLAKGYVVPLQKDLSLFSPMVARETLCETLFKVLTHDENISHPPAVTCQVMKEFLRTLNKSSDADVYFTHVLSDDSQLLLNYRRAGEITVSILMAGAKIHSLTATPTHPSWESLSACPEQTRLFAEWRAWLELPSSSQEKRAEAVEKMVECLLSNGKVLEIDHLQLTSLPSHLPPGLVTLNVSHNSLTSLPELPAGITTLDISHNLLTERPALPATIRNLEINHNPLKALNTDSCLLLYQTILTILPQLEERQKAVRTVSINALTCWFPPKERSAMQALWTPLLKHDSAAAFTTFLTQLSHSACVRDPVFVQQVNFWLHELSRDPYLRERTFGIALEACSTCTDRAALGWNSMQIVRLLHHVELRPNGISPQEFLTLARQIFYIQQIEIAASDKVKMLPDNPDAIEVYLNLFCRLKERLGLPDKFAGNMDYPDVQYLTEAEVTRTEDKILSAEACNFPSWALNWEPCQKYLQRKMSQENIEALHLARMNRYDQALEKLRKEHQHLLPDDDITRMIGLEAMTITDEAIFGPLFRKEFFGLE